MMPPTIHPKREGNSDFPVNLPESKTKQPRNFFFEKITF